MGFARTLFRFRPDLAQHVRSIHLGEGYEPHIESADDIALFKEAEGQLERFQNSESEEAGDENDEDQRTPTYLSLVVGKCTNLEALCISVTWFEETNPVPFSPPYSLPRLTTLSLTHWDTENGFGLGDAKDIFIAAPNITSLYACALVEVEPDLWLPNVTEVDLVNSVLQADCFALLLEQLPNLEKLCYSVGDACVSYDTPAFPREIQEAILSYTPKLKFLQLYMTDTTQFEDLGDDDMLASLKDLGSLEVLRLDAACIIAQRSAPPRTYVTQPNGRVVEQMPDSVEALSAELFVQMLPASIQELEIGSSITDVKLFLPAFLRLSQVCRTEFPQLRYVKLLCLDRSVGRELEEPFEANGVKFETKSTY
ncbi:hypothetical protein CkaCkLH20_13258 [Colletotrichum karsti]|uniref:F-box domain-containing protein n=1 Tax=Colletotrichum karsti TaxID=1095194 RepID=A0A9P6HSY2_9PEZI|nr:uncharacterized protein CkaCkLH20_13258 [Colletotrichum karsti]KAF9869270.1 hypothetical protein CkaCkLH20_13258 [Colletotrichum karsti]